MALAPAKEPRGHAGDDRECGNVGRDHRTRADDRALANGDTGKDDGIDADVSRSPDAYRFDREVGLDDRYIDRHARVFRTEHLGSGSPANVILDDEIARVEVTLRTDPGMVADDAPAIETPLDERLFADEDAVANLEGLGMLRKSPSPDADTVTEAAAERPPDRATHAGAGVAVGQRMLARELEQFLAGMTGSQFLSQRELAGIVRHDWL
jgi:hypothetical protein